MSTVVAPDKYVARSPRVRMSGTLRLQQRLGNIGSQTAREFVTTSANRPTTVAAQTSREVPFSASAKAIGARFVDSAASSYKAMRGAGLSLRTPATPRVATVRPQTTRRSLWSGGGAQTTRPPPSRGAKPFGLGNHCHHADQGSVHRLTC